jgi:hypothetical protein
VGGFRGEELGLVTCAVHPGAGEVVGHDVDEVKISLRVTEVDISKGPFACWEGSGEEVAG